MFELHEAPDVLFWDAARGVASAHCSFWTLSVSVGEDLL